MGRVKEIETINLKTYLSTPTHREGLCFYDKDNHCLVYYDDISGTAIQNGQELVKRVYNNTGSQINNGQVCYLNGFDVTNDVPTVGLANAYSAATCLATIGMATHDIPNGTVGKITINGTVRDVDTSLCTSGDIIYVSDSVDGGWTKTAPTSPSYAIEIGNCAKIDASTGTIEVDVNIGDNRNDVLKIFNGSVLEDDAIVVSSNGTTVTMSLEKTGGGDLSLFFGGDFYRYDSSPAATVELTAGTDTIPVRNWVYIPNSTKVLTKSTVGFPTAEQFIPVADILVPSATTVQTYGTYKTHMWTDHLADSTGMGHLNHINKWIRKQHATWDDGIEPTFTGSGTATINFSSTSGQVLQLHQHTFPAFTSPAAFRVYNDEVTPYIRLTNVAGITTDANGDTLLGRTYALVFWCVISENNNDSGWFVNKPSGSYGADKPDKARNDVSGYTNYTIPSQFKGTGILIHRLVISANIGGTAFTIYTDSSDDIRGYLPNTSAGSSGGAGLGDMLKSVYDTDDDGYVDFSEGLIETSGPTELDMGAVADGQFLKRDGTNIIGSTPAGGGDVVGPASATDNAIVRFNGTSGTSIQDSSVLISDNNKVTIPDNATEGALNLTERSTVPSTPATDDIYLDDGTNTLNGNPSLRRYTGSVWEDIGSGGSSIEEENNIIATRIFN